MTLSKRLRYEILRRDNHACRYCGAIAPDAQLTVDHVVPTALGGPDDPSNLVAACVDCNAGKSSSSPDAPLVADVAQDALRWKRAMELAYEQAMASRTGKDWTDGEESVCRWLFEDWCAWQYTDDDGGKCDFIMAPGWGHTIVGWYRAGLKPDDFSEGVQIAMRKRGVAPEERWRYFCGVMWRMLTERQQAARDLLDAGQVD